METEEQAKAKEACKAREEEQVNQHTTSNENNSTSKFKQKQCVLLVVNITRFAQLVTFYVSATKPLLSKAANNVRE